MSKKDYLKLERKVLSFFQTSTIFQFYGKEYQVVKSGKPRPRSGSGECKTDVYILAQSKKDTIEFKISIKMKNQAEFAESKVSKERAEAVFGENWSQIVQKSAISIADKFNSLPLLFPFKKGNVHGNSITMGWRLEVTHKPRTLSCPICLSDEEIRNSIYKGINLPFEKQHCIVNGEVIENSGVAEYILVASINDFHSSEGVLSLLQKIDDYVLPKTYLTFIANNYRTREKKIDGSRPLVVFVKWFLEEGKLNRKIVFDSPLEQKGKELIPTLSDVLSRLGKMNPDEFDANQDVFNPSFLCG